MSDRLNGLLTGGLNSLGVGSMITAVFHLGRFGAEIVIPPYRRYVSGGDPGDEPRRKDRRLNIWIQVNGKMHNRTFYLSDRRARIAFKAIKIAAKVQEQVKITIGAFLPKDK